MAISVGSVLAGYTIKDMLPNVQDVLVKPPLRFCVYFTIAASLIGLDAIQTPEGIKNAILSALLTTVIVQLASQFITRRDTDKSE